MPSHVLIAEDDSHLAALLRQILETEGFQVTVAINGMDALEKVDAVYPDLVVLDAMMPIVDGFEVLGTLKDDPFHRDLPVLMLTGIRGSTDVHRALASGAADYLTKPFRPDQLVQRVRRLAAGARVRASLALD